MRVETSKVARVQSMGYTYSGGKKRDGTCARSSAWKGRSGIALTCSRQFLASREPCRTVWMRAQLRLTSLPLHLLRLTSRLSDTTRFRVIFSLSFSSFPLLTTTNRIVSQVKFSNDRVKFTTWVIVTYVACYRMTQHETRFSCVVALCRRSRNIWIRAKIQEVTFEVTRTVECCRNFVAYRFDS